MSQSLTIMEFANRLGVSRMTIHRMRKNFELPPTIPTRRRFVRWNTSDVELWEEFGYPKESNFKALKRTKQKFRRN